MGRLTSLKNEIYLFCFIVFGILYLTFDEPKESIFLIISFYFIIKFIKTRECKNFKSIILICLAAYMVSVVILFSKSYKIELNLSDSIDTKEEKAVLLVYEGESEKYNMKKELNNIRNYGSIIDKVKVPLRLYELKKGYRSIGKSSYKTNVNLIKRKLEQELLSDDYDVYVGFLNDSDYMEEVLIDISNKGYKDVIVVPIFIDENDLYMKAKKRIDNMNLYNLNINMKYTETLSSSEKVAKSYVEKINKQIRKESRLYTSVILIGNAENKLQESLMFRNKIEIFLQNHLKLEDHKVKKAWFQSPKSDYIDTVRSALEYGLEELILVYINPGVTNIDNDKILRNINKKVSIPDGVSIKVIDGFLIGDSFVEDIKSRIELSNLQD